MAKFSILMWGLAILFIFTLVFENCSSRRNRLRGRDRERVEISDEYGVSSSSDESHDIRQKMEELAATDDYDKMLSELNGAIGRLKTIKKKYFAGKLTDKQLEEELNNLENDYQPIMEKLSHADQSGELNYKQHKKQVALFAAWLKEWESAVSKVLIDMSAEFN